MLDYDLYLKIFLSESRLYIKVLNKNIESIILNKNHKNNAIFPVIYRTTHSLKKASATLGLNSFNDLIHYIEIFINEIKNKKIKINDEIIEILFEGIYLINILISQIKNNGKEKLEIKEYLLKIEGYMINSNSYEKIKEDKNFG